MLDLDFINKKGDFFSPHTDGAWPGSRVINNSLVTNAYPGLVSENPFEGIANDVPITTMSRGIEIDIRQMIGDDSSLIPNPIPEQKGIQM